MRGRRLAKQIAGWSLPAGIRALVERQLVRGTSNRAAMEAVCALNKKFHSLHQGKRCFILGTGPSLKSQDLRVLRGELTFAVNSFFLHEHYKEVSPTYHVVIDPRYFDSSDETRLWLAALETATRKTGTSLFFPLHARPRLVQEKLFSGQPVHYLSEMGNLSEYWGKCQDPPLDISKPVAGFNNVTLACIALAGYMGFHSIYLIGMDHDMNHIRSLTHFYDVNPYYDERPLNLLDGEYKGDYVALLERFLLTMKCYRLLGIVLGKQGTKIYNATSGGHLDVFQRVEFESLFQGSTKGQ